MRRFQLHHTGIKTELVRHKLIGEFEFQLHHTGIKTQITEHPLYLSEPFQLHHTGIKTEDGRFFFCEKNYFNCTIQELKPSESMKFGYLTAQFQLHHTGIKTGFHGCVTLSVGVFQLHHTGIKTTIEGYAIVFGVEISIAPYRN